MKIGGYLRGVTFVQDAAIRARLAAQYLGGSLTFSGYHNKGGTNYTYDFLHPNIGSLPAYPTAVSCV